MTRKVYCVLTKQNTDHLYLTKGFYVIYFKLKYL